MSPHLSLFLLKGGDTVAVKSAGLPNIIGSTNLRDSVGFGVITTSGCFAKDDSRPDTYTVYPEFEYSGTSLKFDASRCNSLYGMSATVQPPAISLIPQIRY